MSINATFVQVDSAELSGFQVDPSLVETLFEGGSGVPPALVALTKTMQDRVRAAGPQMLAGALSRLDPAIRKQLEERLSRSISALAAGDGGDEILKLMEERRARSAGSAAGERAILSLDKDWHGVHYVLCGEAEPGSQLVSQAVLGGVELGDDEGFSGYGPPRYFTAAQVAELAQALSEPGLESEAAARFDAARMSQLGIYPGGRASDANEVMDGFRRLRDFYADAADKGRAIITCLV
ncbi:MAG: YfbM family protein [Methylocella sp.]